MMRQWHLAELNYGHVKSHPSPEVAVLPLGATEPHNLHLPYGTDTIQVEVIAGRACAQAYERGARVVMHQADAGSMARTRFDAVNRGWVEITRPWHLLTTNSGAGDPRPATAEKGQRLTEIVVERLAGFLVELSAAPVDDSFPY